MPNDSMNVESPKSLFHYTSAEGLLGILRKAALPNSYKESLGRELTMAKSFSLWATDARYLNDQEELLYGASAIADELESVVIDPDPADPGRDLARDALVKVLREPGMVDKVWDESRTPAVYVTCFCQVDDLLSQWRGYGAGAGYSIEFDTRMLGGMYELRGRIGEDPVIMYPTIEVHQVNYGLNPDRVSLAANKILNSPPGAMMWIEALRQLSLFKSDAFSEEREWRVSWVEAAADNVAAQFRVGDRGIIVPYVTALGIPEMAMVENPIRSIRVGPGPDMHLRVQSVEQLLVQRGFANVPVRPSAASFRG